MNRARYDGYVAAREAFAAQPLDPLAAEILGDLAEALLLARDTTEAEAARDAIPGGLGGLVDRRVMTRRTADRFWVHLQACAPPAMSWPSSWDGAPGSARGGAVRGH